MSTKDCLRKRSSSQILKNRKFVALQEAKPNLCIIHEFVFGKVWVITCIFSLFIIFF